MQLLEAECRMAFCRYIIIVPFAYNMYMIFYQSDHHMQTGIRVKPIMQIELQLSVGSRYPVRVIPNARKNEARYTDAGLVVSLQAPAHNNLANTMLVKFFKKSLGYTIEITRGEKSRNKIILVHSQKKG